MAVNAWHRNGPRNSQSGLPSSSNANTSPIKSTPPGPNGAFNATEVKSLLEHASKSISRQFRQDPAFTPQDAPNLNSGKGNNMGNGTNFFDELRRQVAETQNQGAESRGG